MIGVEDPEAVYQNPLRSGCGALRAQISAKASHPRAASPETLWGE